MKQRVIFVSTVFDDVSTGPGVYARYLWDAFRDGDEIEFHIVVPKSTEKHERLHEAGVGRNSFDTYSRIQRVARTLASRFDDEALIHGNAAHSMAGFLDYSGPWVVQVNDYEAAEIWRHPWKVMFERGMRRFGSLVWRNWQERKVINAATRVVVNSSFTLDKIRTNYGDRRTSRFTRIYKSVDTSQSSSNIEYQDPFPDRPIGARIVFVGSDWRRKGLEDLLVATKIVSERIPNAHLTVGGPSGAGEMAQIRAIVSRNNLLDNVKIAGRLDRNTLQALHRYSDVFVLPSHEEALGVALLEAMAAGLPVVASDVGGILEIVADDENGLTFGCGDPAQLASTIEQLLTNGPLREKVKANGLKTADKFSTKTMILAVREMYKLVDGEFSREHRD